MGRDVHHMRCESAGSSLVSIFNHVSTWLYGDGSLRAARSCWGELSPAVTTLTPSSVPLERVLVIRGKSCAIVSGLQQELCWGEWYQRIPLSLGLGLATLPIAVPVLPR